MILFGLFEFLGDTDEDCSSWESWILVLFNFDFLVDFCCCCVGGWWTILLFIIFIFIFQTCLRCLIHYHSSCLHCLRCSRGGRVVYEIFFELLFVYMLRSGRDVFRCRTLCHNENIVIYSKIESWLLEGDDEWIVV